MDNAGLKVLINDEKVVIRNNFTIEMPVLNTPSTILNNVYPMSWEEDKDYVSRYYYPKDWSSCEIYFDETLVFAGAARNTAETTLNPRHPKLASVEVLDYKCLLSEGRNFEFVIAGKTVREAIEMVIKEVSDYGFIIGNIYLLNPDEIIGAYSTLNKSAYDVLQYLSEITQSRWFTRMIDKDTIAIDFYNPEFIPKESDIEYTKEYWEENNIVNMEWLYSTRDYRNKQVINSEKTYASIYQDENINVNNYTKTFNTEQIIGNIINIQVNGEEKTVTTNNYKNLGFTADFYYTPGEKEFTSASYVQLGSVIHIEYQPIVTGREIAYNIDEIQRITDQIDRNGTIERYETRNDVLYSSELQEVAKSYIQYKGVPELNLKITTKNKDIFTLGKQVYFNFDGFKELATNYLVKNKIFEIYQRGSERDIFITYTLSSNFDCEEAINYFDNQRRKTSGNIGEGEFITRNIDLNNTANIIFDNLEIEEITIEAGNVLDCALDSPLNQ